MSQAEIFDPNPPIENIEVMPSASMGGGGNISKIHVLFMND